MGDINPDSNFRVINRRLEALEARFPEKTDDGLTQKEKKVICSILNDRRQSLLALRTVPWSGVNRIEVIIDKLTPKDTNS